MKCLNVVLVAALLVQVLYLPCAAQEEEQAALTVVPAERETEPAGAVRTTLSEAVGDTIDSSEARHYGLFTNVGNFVSAIYFQMPNGGYVVKLTRLDQNGVEIREINRVSNLGIEIVRNRLRRPSEQASAPVITPPRTSTSWRLASPVDAERNSWPKRGSRCPHRPSTCRSARLTRPRPRPGPSGP